MARLRTARGVAVEEAVFFSDSSESRSCVDVLVAWPSLGVDRAAAYLTPDDDHHVEPMGAKPEASAISCYRAGGHFLRFRGAVAGRRLRKSRSWCFGKRLIGWSHSVLQMLSGC